MTYYYTPEGFKLVWKLETDLDLNWLITYAHAQEKGSVVGVVDYVADAFYNVYKLGVSDPGDGVRTIEDNPALLSASPNSWHISGTANYTVTRGNNGISQENWDAGTDYLNNVRANGGTTLDFDFPFSLTDSSPHNYIAAATAQLFYTANAYHDLLESLGFTEAAGNFEDVNTSPGGLGNDAVQLNAQDGSGMNNANFATPVDGQRPRMRMYLWNSVPGPQRDGDFDNGVIIHEYTHGLSNRLTGGPSRSSCLGNAEGGGMGEGWGDFFATAIRIKAADTRTKVYAMGDWVNGKGPYSPL